MATKQQTSVAAQQAWALRSVRAELAALAADVEARYGVNEAPVSETGVRSLNDLAAELRALRAGPGLAG